MFTPLGFDALLLLRICIAVLCTLSVVIKHGLPLPRVWGLIGDYQQLGNSHAKKAVC